MNSPVLWHNPRCSKSRAALQLLNERGIEPAIRDYLGEPPQQDELHALLKALNMRPRELLRSGEDAYKTLNLADTALDDTDLVQAMCEHPRLIERPILQVGERAVVGRPPERVLELIEAA